MERYNEALESLLKAKEIAEINNDEIQIMIAEGIIAELKTILGKDQTGKIQKIRSENC